MGPLNVEQLFRELSDIKAAVGGVNDRLDVSNGRLRSVERKVFAMWLLWSCVGAAVVAAAGAVLSRWP